MSSKVRQWRWRFPYDPKGIFSSTIPWYLALPVLITHPRVMIGDRACRALSCHVLTAWRATTESPVCIVRPQKVGLGIGFIG
jgi:hypothetical protein